MKRPVASVIVPAHNEQEAIAGTLDALLAGAHDGEFDVVVVCNGCVDRTAEIARGVPGVRVEEIAAASKIQALRHGDACTAVFPRIYLDGDVRLSTDAARALVATLDDPRYLVAGLRGALDLTASSGAVRRYMRFRQRLPVFQHGIIGAGVYALSAQGRQRFGSWPDVLGDDQFVFRMFAPHERATVAGHRTRVEAPPDLATLVRRGVRVRRGNQQLTRGGGGSQAVPAPAAGIGVALRSVLTAPREWPSAAVWVTVNVLIRGLARVRPGSGDWAAGRQGSPR